VLEIIVRTLDRLLLLTSRIASQEKTIKRLDNNFKHAFVRRFPLRAHERALVLLLYDCARLTKNTTLQAKYRDRPHGTAHSLPKQCDEAINQLELHVSKLQLSSDDFHCRLVADANAVRDQLRALSVREYRKRWLAVRSPRQ
jgi:hypothetical protein